MNGYIDKNDLSYWFPILAKTGVKVPRTEIVQTDIPLIELLDGRSPKGFHDFIGSLMAATRRVGNYPIFLRSGHVSGKHDWKRTCFVEKESDLASHVAAIVEYGEIVSFIGLPTKTWAIREFLPLRHEFTAFDGMPVANERRFFFRNGKVVCDHPYWPEDSIRNPSCVDWKEKLNVINNYSFCDSVYCENPTINVAQSFYGYWSIDWAQHQDGSWYAIDMALGDESYHWAGCPNEPEDQRQRRIEEEEYSKKVNDRSRLISKVIDLS